MNVDLENELREQLLRAEALIANAPVGVIVLAMDGGKTRCEFFSDGLCRMFGYTRQEAEGLFNAGLLYAVHPEDRARVSFSVHEAVKLADEFREDYRVLHKNGNYVWISLTGKPVVDGGIVRVYCSCSDISEHIKIEEDIRARNERSRLFIALNNFAVFDYDYESDTLHLETNYAGKGFVSKAIPNYFAFAVDGSETSVEDARTVRRLIRTAGMTPVSDSVEFRTNLWGTGRRWARIIYTSIADDYGNVCRITGLICDIQKEKDREEMLGSLSPHAAPPAYDPQVVADIFAYLNMTKDTDAAISHVLSVLGRHYRVSRVYVFENSSDNHFTSNTFEWCSEGISPEKDNLQNIPYKGTFSDNYADNFDENGFFLCRDINELPSDQRDYLTAQGIKSMLQLSIVYYGKFSGFIGFDDCMSPRDWPPAQIGTLSIISKLIGLYLLRKRSQESAVLSADFIAALDNSTSYIYIVDPADYTVIYVNQAAKTRFGDDVSGRFCYELMGKCTHCAECPIDSLLRAGSSKPVEFERQGGMWLLSQASPIHWNGRSMYMVTCTDISEQKRLAEQLRTLTDAVPGAIVSGEYDFSTQELTMKYFNDEMCRITGYSREEYSTMNQDELRALVFPEDEHRLGELVADVVERGLDVFHSEYRISSKNGPKWIQLTGRIAKDNGGIAQVYIVLLDITERKIAEAELAFKSDCLEKVDEALSAGTIINSLGLNGPLLYVSANIEKFIGYTAAEFMQMHNNQYRDIIYPEDFERTLELNNRYAAEQPPYYEMEFRFVRKDGSVFWTMEKATLLPDFQGQPAYISVFVDISSQKKAQEALAVEEEAYKIAVEHSSSLVYRYDYGAGIIWRSGGDQVFRLTLENLDETLASADNIARRSLTVCSEFCKSLIAGVEGATADLCCCVDGVFRWFRSDYSLIRSKTGELVSAVITLTDVETEKRFEAENALIRRDRDMMITATQTMFPLCIFVNLSKNSYYMIENARSNNRNMQDTGVYDDLLETGIASVPDEDKETFHARFCRENLLLAHSAGKGIVSFIHRQRGDDGLMHWNRTVAIFVENEIDDDILEITLSECIDSQKIPELELREREAELEKALAQAQNASKAKSNFLSNMSHDLRTPLNSVINIALLAVDNVNNPEKITDDLQQIGLAGEFMLGLINDILDMSRIENGKIELQPSVYHHQEFLNYIEGVIGPQCSGKAINFVLNAQKRNISLIVDKVRINQIFFNILSNAVKYTPEGGDVTFTEDITPTEDRHIIYACRIEDNGIGMSDEFQKRLFRPFERESNTEAFTGTGLGLTITKNLVELMGGSILIESRRGIGTKVFVRLSLPVATETDRESLGDDTSAVAKSSQQSPVGKHVLVVEDNSINQSIVRRILEKVGYVVDCVDNGREAVNLLITSVPGYYMALLMDVRMPVMDGLEATRRIRKLPSTYAEVPIIAMTANAFNEDAGDCFRAGMNAFLSKPVMPEKLYETLAMYLN